MFGQTRIEVMEVGGHAWGYHCDSDKAYQEAIDTAKQLGHLLRGVTIISGSTQRPINRFVLDESKNLCEVWID